MPIRIQGSQPPVPPAPEEMPVPQAPMEQEEAVSQPAMLAGSEAGKVSPQVARYMSSDMGPFICANCNHFQQDGSCEVVSGPIDPEGVCILFTPPESGAGIEGVAEDVEPVEEPVEEEVA